jgi:hypothetical protein
MTVLAIALAGKIVVIAVTVEIVVVVALAVLLRSTRAEIKRFTK